MESDRTLNPENIILEIEDLEQGTSEYEVPVERLLLDIYENVYSGVYNSKADFSMHIDKDIIKENMTIVIDETKIRKLFEDIVFMVLEGSKADVGIDINCDITEEALIVLKITGKNISEARVTKNAKIVHFSTEKENAFLEEYESRLDVRRKSEKKIQFLLEFPAVDKR